VERKGEDMSPKKVVYFASNFLCFPYYYSKYFFASLLSNLEVTLFSQ